MYIHDRKASTYFLIMRGVHSASTSDTFHSIHTSRREKRNLQPRVEFYFSLRSFWVISGRNMRMIHSIPLILTATTPLILSSANTAP